MSGVKKQKGAAGEARAAAAGGAGGDEATKRKEQKGKGAGATPGAGAASPKAEGKKKAQPKGEAKKAPAAGAGGGGGGAAKPKKEAGKKEAGKKEAGKKEAGKKEAKKEGKKEKKEGKGETKEEEAEEEVSADLAAVQASQKKIELLHNKQGEEVHEIEKKYNKLRVPLFAERNAAIAKVPGFWAQAWSQHELLGRVLEESDLEILKSLTNLEVVENEDYRTGFQVTLTFSENKYFSNTTVTRDFKVTTEEGEGEDKEQKIEIVISPALEWKDPKFPTAKKNKNTFFVNWFDPKEECAEVGETIRDSLYRDPFEALNGDGPESDDDEGAQLFTGDSDDDEGDEKETGGDDE